MTTKQHNSEYEEEELVSPMEGIDEVTISEDKRQVESDPKKNIYTSRHRGISTYPPRVWMNFKLSELSKRVRN